MDAVFQFRNKKHLIEVPMWVFHLSQLTDQLASNDLKTKGLYDDSSDEWLEAYGYLTEQITKIFLLHFDGVLDSNLAVEFFQAQTEQEKIYGSVIGIVEL